MVVISAAESVNVAPTRGVSRPWYVGAAVAAILICHRLWFVYLWNGRVLSSAEIHKLHAVTGLDFGQHVRVILENSSDGGWQSTASQEWVIRSDKVPTGSAYRLIVDKDDRETFEQLRSSWQKQVQVSIGEVRRISQLTNVASQKSGWQVTAGVLETDTGVYAYIERIEME